MEKVVEKSRLIHLIHGINTKDPYSNIGKLEQPLLDAGYETNVYSYGKVRFWQARFKNKDIATKLSTIIYPDDVLIGHSNGCEIIRRILDDGTKCKGVILINPALNRDTVFGPGCDFIHVYHNHGDWVVALSRLLLLHPWGDMGRGGYTGTDQRVRNFNTAPLVKGHSEPFNSSEWISRMINNMEEALNE